MSEISLSTEQKEQAVDKLKRYFDSEMGQDLGQFEAEFLFDFISENFGNYFYNQGLYDAQAMISNRIDLITDAIFELEKPVN